MIKTKLASLVIGTSLLLSSAIPVFASSVSGTSYTSGGSTGTQLAVSYQLSDVNGYAYAGTYVKNGTAVDLVTAKSQNMSTGRIDYNQATRKYGVTTSGQYVGNSGGSGSGILVHSTHKIEDYSYGNFYQLGDNGCNLRF